MKVYQDVDQKSCCGFKITKSWKRKKFSGNRQTAIPKTDQKNFKYVCFRLICASCQIQKGIEEGRKIRMWFGIFNRFDHTDCFIGSLALLFASQWDNLINKKELPFISLMR